MSRAGLSYIKAGALGWCVGSASAVTSYMGNLTTGKPFQAVRNVFTDYMGNMFYAVGFGILFMGMWLRLNNLTFPVVIFDILMATFNTYMPPEAMYFAYAINVLAVAAVIYRLMSPVYVE